MAADYSGHRWDPKDPGWGIFVSQDIKDNILVAWLTYKADGSPAWYVFQPKWWLESKTLSSNLFETSRQPTLSMPQSNAPRLNPVGTASIDFSTKAYPDFAASLREGFQEAVITFQLIGRPEESRKLRRF